MQYTAKGGEMETVGESEGKYVREKDKDKERKLSK